MKYRNHIFVLLAIIAIGIVFLLNRTSDQEHNVKKHEDLPSSISPATATTSKTLLPTEVISQQIKTDSPPVGSSSIEKWKWLAEMMRKDPSFQFKAPISFYGRVVDEAGSAIGGVTIDLSWTDNSEATGNSTRTVVSDGHGLFSVEGVHGSALLVRGLTKQGYTKSLSQNKFSYKYGYFPDPYYHSPNPMNPVGFVMRKNHEAEPLIEYSEKRAEVEQGQSKQFTIGPNNTTLLFERMTNAPGRGGWIARVSVPGGGLALTTEEFPYEAPEEGYVDLIEITNAIPKPPNWPYDYGAMLYFKTSQVYGRVMVRYISNMDRMFVTSWYNPNSNSRNLEIDPSKLEVIKP